MKKLYITLSLFLASLIYAQVPQAFSYQTIAFNSAGAPIANGNVNLRISILDNSATGTVLYTETHTKTTNSKGLVNLNIGQGTATTGNFGGINWGTNAKFVKVELDPAGGNNYTNVGVNQLMSVPFALVAGNISSNSIIGSVESDNGATGILTTTNAYAFGSYTSGTTTSNSWYSQSISGTPMKIIGSNDGIGVLTSNRAYAFGSYASGTTVSNSWYSQTLSGNVKDIIGSNGTFGVLTSSNVYAFGPYKAGTTISNSWYSQSLSGTPIKIVTSKGVIGVLTSTMAYAFGSYTSGTTVSNSWYSQSLSGTPIDIVAKNGKILVYTSTNVYSYGSYTSGTTTSNSWYSQSLSGTPIGVTN